MKPEAIKLPFKLKNPVLGLGPQSKNRVCFAVGNRAYLGRINQDLANPIDFAAFRKQANYFLRRRPGLIAHDLHPGYQSTKYAYQLSAGRYRLAAVQHHHAHIASCMAENGLTNQRVIGVAFDGTGLGSDNSLWGAEFLVCDYRGFKRAAHLKEIPLLGQERAIKEPLRLALAWLYPLYKDKLLSLGLFRGMPENKYRVLKKMYYSGFNSPLASSMGRLFDAVGSIVLNKGKISSEAELAVKLEALAEKSRPLDKGYAFRIKREKKLLLLDPVPVFQGINADLIRGRPKEEVAYSFHLGVAEMLAQTCGILRKKYRLKKVALSGGVFQNKLLLRLVLDLLYKEGFTVFRQRKLSCADSGLCLGQVAVANFQG